MGIGIFEQCCSLSKRHEEVYFSVKGTKVVWIGLSFDLNGIGHSGVTRGLICSLWAQIYREEKVHGDVILFAPLPQQSLRCCVCAPNNQPWKRWYIPHSVWGCSISDPYLKTSKHQEQNKVQTHHSTRATLHICCCFHDRHVTPKLTVSPAWCTVQPPGYDCSC